MFSDLAPNTVSLLCEWRNERARRVARKISWAGLVLASISTVVDVFFLMPAVVLIGDAVMLSCFSIAVHFSRQKSKKPVWIWGPPYFGVWLATFTSLLTTGGIRSPFVGGYMALICVGGLVIQAEIKSFWIVVFTMMNLTFWFIAEIFYPHGFGQQPHLIFNVLINSVVVAALIVYTYEFLKTESNLASEILERYQELEKTRQLVLKEENANAAKSTFLANISHELRTPLGAILGYAELILQDPPRNQVHEYSDTILRNGHQLSRLVDDVLDLSKIEAGKIELENIEFEPKLLFSEILDLMRVQSQKKLIELKISFLNIIPENVVSDPMRIKQILLNVISNAIKFTEGGKIDVRVFFEKESSKFRIEIQDSGQGLTPEEQTRLFKPFSQADSTISRKFGGTGLGLCLSRDMARFMGGDLRLSWSQSDLGSQFDFYIPVKVVEEKQQQQKEIINCSAQIGTQVLDRIKILLVDDTSDNQKLISLFLEPTGASVDVASNGAEAIQKTRGFFYDIVLMDVQMPVMDGLQAARLLRQQSFQGPLIAITARAMKEDRERCLAAGFDDYLTKPIDRQVLIGKIRTWVSQKGNYSEFRS